MWRRGPCARRNSVEWDDAASELYTATCVEVKAEMVCTGINEQ